MSQNSNLAVTSHVLYPNTAESDKQEKVWNVVIDGNGFEYEVFSACPSTAIDDFMAGKAKLRRVAANLDTLLVTYKNGKVDQSAYELMHEASIKLGLEILKHESGAYAVINDSWWWVSPNNGVLQVFCSPEDLVATNFNDGTYMLKMSDELSLEDIESTCKSINEWLANPDIKYGNQTEMDLIVKTFNASAKASETKRPRM